MTFVAVGALRVNENVQPCVECETETKYSATVKTLYNVTRYNRIFNIQHKIAGNGSVSIKIPSL